MNQNVNAEVKAAQQKKAPPRFSMFVVLQENVITWYPHQKRTWCYRGDNFTSDESVMLRSLINILVGKGIEKFKIVEIYDNKFPANDPKKYVVQIKKGSVEINQLKFYSWMLEKAILPDYLKP